MFQSLKNIKLLRSIKILLINCLILIIGILILELTYGTWFQSSKLNRLNILRNFFRTYDASSLYETKHKFITYARDSYGFRGNYPDPAHIDILTVGGSTTDQIYIDTNETWQEILAQRFKERDKTISVVNGGMDGMSTFGHLASFDYWYSSIPNFHARYYLLYIGTNDFITNPLLHNDQYLRGSIINNPIDYMKQNSALYWLTIRLYGAYSAKYFAQVTHGRIDFQTQEWTETPKKLADEYESIMQTPLLEYRERLTQLFQKIQEQKGIPICITPGSRKYKIVEGHIYGITTLQEYKQHMINGVDYFHMMRLLHAATLDECHKAGGLTFDADRDITWEDADFYDYIHNTPQGTKKIGNYLYENLKDTIQK